MLEQSWKKIYSRTTTKSVPLLQPEHGFCQRKGSEHGKVFEWKLWSCFPFVWIVDVVIQGAWVLYRIKKDKGFFFFQKRKKIKIKDKVFWRKTVNVIYLKYSDIQIWIRNIPSDVCYDDTKHYQVQSEHRRILNSLNSLTGYAKTLHLKCSRVFWTRLWWRHL